MVVIHVKQLASPIQTNVVQRVPFKVGHLEINAVKEIGQRGKKITWIVDVLEDVAQDQNVEPFAAGQVGSSVTKFEIQLGMVQQSATDCFGIRIHSDPRTCRDRGQHSARAAPDFQNFVGKLDVPVKEVVRAPHVQPVSSGVVAGQA